MRILVVTQYFWPENFRINDLCAELVERGHQVVVLTGISNYPSGEVLPDYRNNPEDFLDYKGVEIIRVPMFPRRKGRSHLLLNYITYAISASTIGLWKCRNRNFDLVFACQLSPVTIGLPAAVLAKIKRIPMAMWVLDLWPDSLLAVGIVKSEKVIKLISKLVAFIYRQCDLIFAQSRSFIPHIAKLSPYPQRIKYSPSWAEDLYSHGSEFPAVEVPLQDGTFNVMFAGNLGEAQDFACILRAATRLKENKNIRFLIVGDGRMASWIHNEIDRLNLNQQVLMLGCFPIERMPSFFQHAQALLVTLADQPIFAMTIPGKLQSYLAAGVPVVAALNGEGADVIRRANAGIVVSSGDDEALANAIVQLSMMEPDHLIAMGKNGWEYNQREFDRKLVIDNLEESLKELSRSYHFH